MSVATDSDLKEIFAKFEQKFDKMEQKFDQRFDKIDQKFAQIDQRFDKIDQKFAQIDQRFDKIDQRFDKIETKIDNTQKDIIDVKISQTKLEGKINGLETTMAAEVSGLGKRLDNQEFINRTVVAGVVLALLATVVILN